MILSAILKKSEKMKMETLKVDWDGPWGDYRRLFEFRYSKLCKTGTLRLLTSKRPMVEKTRNGYHVYFFAAVEKYLPQTIRSMYEVLLGDDVNRAMYNVCEKSDILFVSKNGKKTKYDKKKSDALYEIIIKISRMKKVKVLEWVGEDRHIP